MSEKQSYYCLGIGGMGMTPLALYLAQAGHAVAGQDRALNERNRRLLEAGGVTVEDWNLNRPLPDAHFVISSAISANNPFYIRAQEAGIPVSRRGALQAELVNPKSLVAIAGSHGKTTTTGLVSWGLEQSEVDANWLVGGLFRAPARPPAHYSPSADWVVAEVDESDGTMDRCRPRISIILNLDWDHADQYPTTKDLETAFVRLMENTGEGLLVPAGGRLESMARDYFSGTIRTFGEGGDYHHKIVSSDLDGLTLSLEGSFEPREIFLPLAGTFNARNAVAALGALHWMTGATPGAEVFSKFPGLLRRQERLLEQENLSVWEDYAHHPTEIKEILNLMQGHYPDRELVVVFQPHRFSRTRTLKRELAQALAPADRIFIQPVYGASETEEEAGNLDSFLTACGEADIEVDAPHPGPDLFSSLRSHTDAPKTILFVGAGDVTEQGTVFSSLIEHKWDIRESWLSWVQAQMHPDCLLALDEPLNNKTTLRVGGTAQCYAEPANFSDLRVLLRSAAHFGLPRFILGRGSNLLIPDEGFPGLVIRFQHPFWRRIEPLDDDRLLVGAGTRLRDLATQAARLELSGFEFMEGIPGSLGGSLRMNAGAMGSWMFDVVERVQLMKADGTLLDLDRSAFRVGYRNVEELKQWLALGAVLKSPGREATDAIRKKMQDYMLSRKASQPRDPSAGCIFKNPDGDAAGRLIDTAGLKGLRVGEAQVSEIHGNFIINRGEASSQDVLDLVKEVRRRVLEKHGIELEPEVLLMGATWEEILRS